MSKTTPHNLLDAPPFYKPMKYTWAYDAWLQQQRVIWLPEEVPLADDVKEWHNVLTPAEKHLVTQIFRFFTQSDIEVNGAYTLYQRWFKPIEILMMLQAFQNIETIHIAAYAHLLDTIGMPETEYSAFMNYKEMKAKHDFLQSFDPTDKKKLALTMAAFFAFAEGMALFASFAILLNFPRFGKMKGMGQIVSWSIRDETLHSISGCKLFRAFLMENPEINTFELRDEIKVICEEMVSHEDAFIDLAFELGSIEGLTPEEVKQFIRYIADRRMALLGYDPVYNIPKNPLPWFDEMTSANEHVNFFENRATEYSRAATTGTWEKAFFTGKHILYTFDTCPSCQELKKNPWITGRDDIMFASVPNKNQRNFMYDRWGLKGSDRTFPKMVTSEGILLKSSKEILEFFQ